VADEPHYRCELVVPDKRDECGCHRDCTTLPHDCDQPCRWPNCLTEAEHRALAGEVMAGLAGAPQPPEDES
jgi:hypothetical protein